jgi:GNAT superfamily N-acetyltransferase
MTSLDGLTLRRATSDDAALLTELGTRTFRDTFSASNTPADMAAYLAASFSPEKQREELSRPDTTFLIAEIEGKPAGYAQLRSEPAPEGGTQLELVRLYSTQEWLGRGVGAALMHAFVDAGRDGGHGKLLLCVWEHNPRAIAFYRKWGFETTGTVPFVLGSDQQTDLVMEREL